MSDNITLLVDASIVILLLVIGAMIIKRFYQENFAVKKSKNGKKKKAKKAKKAKKDKSLYKFESHTFTSANKSGPNGPTIYELRNAYAGTNWAQNEKFFNMNVQGIQRWTVPVTGKYTIRAVGASGANPRSYCRGRDVQLSTTLKKGEVLQILVGQQGIMTPYSNGGAGGGTFVVRDFQTPIIIAGGGGGIANQEFPNSNAVLSRWGNKGGNGDCDYCGNGGYDGNGGQAATWYSSGGGGLISNGTNNDQAKGGLSFINGGTGGLPLACSVDNCVGCGSGGFGGGGASTCGGGAGGGGGYSGGGGGATPYWASGGGGGSYGISDLTDFGATNTGNGRVTITLNK